jgi:RNA polymerase sigma factor (sigma-70 family)
VSSPKAPRGLPPFERIVELHGRALWRFCAAQAGRDRADDCFQETMLAALRAYDQVREAGAIRSWLFAIAVHKAIDGRRDEVRAPEPVAALDSLATTVEPASHDDALWSAVRSLPDKQRRAVSLRYLADLSHREIGEVMGTTEASARRNVFEGVRRLKRDLGTP